MNTKKSVKEARAGLIPQSDWDRKEKVAEGSERVQVLMTLHECDTLLAALRHWQQDRPRIAFIGKDPAYSLGKEYAQWEIASEHGEPLSNPEIDELCEHINTSPKPEDPVITVEGGVIQDVFVPIPDGKSPTTSVAYSLLDYDVLKDGDFSDEDAARLWASFSPALQAYYKKHCRDEFKRYFKHALDAQPRIIPTTFGNQKTRPKCYRCARVIRDAEYMREGPVGEGKARHINACPPAKS